MSHNQGFVLISALIYLTIIMFLVSAVLNQSIIQIKISNNAWNELVAFENAETALITAEDKIQSADQSYAEEISAEAKYSYKKLPQSICGGNYFQIDAEGRSLKSVRKIQSILWVPGEINLNCDHYFDDKKRIFWKEII